MKHTILASTLAFSLIMIGCGDRSAPEFEAPKVEELALKAETISAENNTIITDEDYKTVTLLGEYGSKLFINGEEVGVFPESGFLEVTLSIKDVGIYSYNVYSSSDSMDSETIMIEIIKKEKSASIGTISTTAQANALTVSDDGIIFVAEKNLGVEIISIGFDDKISSDVLTTIYLEDAQNVILSDDENRLYIEDSEGSFHLMDISDLSNPIEIDVVESIEKSISIISDDATMRYRISPCGLIGEDISNPVQNERKFLLRDKKIEDVVLVDGDSKLLVAHGTEGLQLYDISHGEPDLIGSRTLGDKTLGLSLLQKDGILFVANGASGVQLFNLEILLYEMMR